MTHSLFCHMTRITPYLIIKKKIKQINMSSEKKRNKRETGGENNVTTTKKETTLFTKIVKESNRKKDNTPTNQTSTFKMEVCITHVL